MRILQATTNLRNGSGIVFTDLCSALARSGNEVHAVYAGRHDLPSWPELEDQLQADGVHLHRIDLFKRDPAAIWRAEEAFGRLVANYSFHVAHLHSGTPAYVNWLARIKRRAGPIVSVGTLHGLGSSDRPLWMAAMDRLGWSHCDRLTAVSEGTRLAALGRGLPDSLVIHPGLRLRDLERPKPLGVPEQAGSSPINVCQVAGIEPNKGQVELVLACAATARKLKRPIRCTLVGAAEDERYLAEVRRTGADCPDVELLLVGRTQDPTPFIDAAAVCVFPSRAEGLGLAIIECLARGRPTLFAAVEGTFDIAAAAGVTHATFPPGDSEGLANLLAQAILYPPSAIERESVAQRTAACFSASRFAEQHFDLYQQLLHSKKQPIPATSDRRGAYSR